jgi:hypothetical protein
VNIAIAIAVAINNEQFDMVFTGRVAPRFKPGPPSSL